MKELGTQEAQMHADLANLAAFVDIGRWWNFYQIALPWNINLNSVMFEIAAGSSGPWRESTMWFTPPR